MRLLSVLGASSPPALLRRDDRLSLLQKMLWCNAWAGTQGKHAKMVEQEETLKHSPGSFLHVPAKAFTLV